MSLEESDLDGRHLLSGETGLGASLPSATSDLQPCLESETLLRKFSLTNPVYELIARDMTIVNRSDPSHAVKFQVDQRPDMSGDCNYTVNEALNRATFGRFQRRLMFVTGLCSAGDAVEALLLSFLLQEIGPEWHLAGHTNGVIGAVVFLGVLIGNLASGAISDYYGRWYAFVISGALISVFGVLSAFATNVVWLGLTRFAVGIGLGGGHTAFTLFTEFLPMRNRGKLLLINQVFWSVGAVFEVLLAWALLPTYGWRALLMLSTLPIIIALLFSYRYPESPMFLASSGRIDEAIDILNKVSAENGGTLHTEQWCLIPPCSAHKTSITEKIAALATDLGPTSRRLWVLWFSSNMVYYGIILISTRYFPSQGEYKDILLATMSEFPGVLIPFFGLDTLGRRKTLTALYLIAATACIGLTAQLSELSSVGLVFIARGTISAAFISLYVVTAESYPTSLRSTGFGVASSIARIAGMATSLISEDKSVTFALLSFSMCSFLASLAAFTLPVETANVGLPDDMVLTKALDNAGLLGSQEPSSPASTVNSADLIPRSANYPTGL